MKTIILFKATPSDESENSFEVMLMNEGLHVISIKTLDFEFKNLPILRDHLNSPGKYAGIVFTSPRCVTSVQKAIDGESLHTEWFTKKNYGVGPKTVDSALNILNLNCLGAEAGNANNLADIIIAQHGTEKAILPFLYPKGNMAKDTLKQKLGERSITLADVIVYDTVCSATFESDVTTATDHFKLVVDYIVYFSPSGVNASVPYFSKLNHPRLKVIAIGPTTETALKELNISVFGTPEKPSPSSLIALLKKLELAESSK